jgi:hypothetical protein
VPSSLTCIEPFACSATSPALRAVCSEAARTSSTVVEVSLIAADCWLALAVCWLTAARISEVELVMASAPART